MAIFGCIYLLCFPFIGFFYSVIGLWKNPIRWRRFVPFLVYFLLIGAYAYETHSEFEDLFRYIPAIEEYGKLSFYDVLQNNNDGLYSRDILFWFFGYLQIPHMVPAITTATVYAVAFYITCDTAEKYGKENCIWILLLFQLAMLPYISLINNVRNVFSLSLIILAVYLDLVKKRRDLFVVICYIFGASTHLSAFILIVFRFLSRFLKNIFELLVIVPLVFSPLVSLLYHYKSFLYLGGSFGYIVNQIIDRLYGYINFNYLPYAVMSLNSITVKLDRTIMVIGMSIALILISYGLRTNKQIFMDDKRFYVFVGLIALTSILLGISMAMPNFWRFSAAFYTTFGALIIPYVKQYKNLPLFIRIVILIYVLLGFLSLILQLWKLTWIEFGNWLFAFLTTNMVSILYNLIEGIIGI